MFWSKPEPVLDEDHQRWMDASAQSLMRLLGRQRVLNATVITPDDRYFPDPYRADEASAHRIAGRIAGYLGVSPTSFELSFLEDAESPALRDLPTGYRRTRGAAGLYLHEPTDGRYTIAVRRDLFCDPARLAATLVHELTHVILLGGGLMDQHAPHMEPLTDLATVLLGCGILTANAAFIFRQDGIGRSGAWSVTTQGYLDERAWAYALAWYARERGEPRPEWRADLAANIRPYFDRAERQLRGDRNSSAL